MPSGNLILGIHNGLQSQPLPALPTSRYIVKTISSLNLSPRFLSVGDNIVPVPLLISRFRRTINRHLTLGLFSRKALIHDTYLLVSKSELFSSMINSHIDINASADTSPNSLSAAYSASSLIS